MVLNVDCFNSTRRIEFPEIHEASMIIAWNPDSGKARDSEEVHRRPQRPTGNSLESRRSKHKYTLEPKILVDPPNTNRRPTVNQPKTNRRLLVEDWRPSKTPVSHQRPSGDLSNTHRFPPPPEKPPRSFPVDLRLVSYMSSAGSWRISGVFHRVDLRWRVFDGSVVDLRVASAEFLASKINAFRKN